MVMVLRSVIGWPGPNRQRGVRLDSRGGAVSYGRRRRTLFINTQQLRIHSRFFLGWFLVCSCE